MSLYTKARKHIDMNRVKELREEKIKRKKIADEIREQIREELRTLNSPEFSNWRYDLDEGMTTSDLFQTTLPAQGDVDLEYINNNVSTTGTTTGFSQNGNNYTFGPSKHNMDDPFGSSMVMNPIDSTKYDTISFDFSGGTINTFYMGTASPASNRYDLSIASGRKTITLKSDDRKSSLSFLFHVENFVIDMNGNEAHIPVGTNIISNLSFQRRAPMNVFVGLDSPEATAFIRTDPTMQGLSAEDRKKKLLDMLDAGDEYLLKYLGMTGSSARPSDTTMPDSWEQAAAPGPKGMDRKPGSYSPNIIIPIKTPGSKYKDGEGYEMIDPFKNSPATFPGLSKQGKDYGDVAATYGGAEAEKQKKIDAWIKKHISPGSSGGGGYKPGKGRGMGDTWEGPVRDAKIDKKPKTMVTHYEPEGEVLSEKKRLKSPKDIASKIPGYYDGKPAPLGFPMQEPPKMKNGFHPDLVTPEGQKKQSNRYNRLDPASAKAMPPTGNPHIDKKVRAAAKKPK